MKNKIYATFRGDNGSCGFETGTEYYFVMEMLSKEDKIVIRIEANSVKEKLVCEYESVVSFLKNWEKIFSVERIKLT